MNKFISLTFDLEEFSSPIDYEKKIETEEMFQISLDGLEKCKKILDKFKIKTTFFITKEFIIKSPETVKKLAEEKHEIALHCSSYDIKILSLEKKLLEDISQTKVIGTRYHKFSRPNFRLLKRIKIIYDSSINPTYIPGRYNYLMFPRKPFVINNIIEIPISTVPILRIPFSFVWFRNLGLTSIKICSSIVLKEQKFINLYFHPWEFTDLRSFDIPTYLKRKTGNDMCKLLEKYIKWCLDHKVRFISMKNYIKKLKVR